MATILSRGRWVNIDPRNYAFYFLFVSLLSHFWHINFFSSASALSTICRPLSSYMCSITPETAKVCNSYSHMRGPGIDCWFSDRFKCSHWSFEVAVLLINPNIYTGQWQPIFIYHSITLLVVTQLRSPHCWHLHSKHCCTIGRQSQLRFVLPPLLLHLRLLGMFQLDIPLFMLTWPDKHSPRMRVHTQVTPLPLGGVFYSP